MTTLLSDELLPVKKHALFALRHAKFLPPPYQTEDYSRTSLAYFSLSVLSLLPSTAISNDTSRQYVSAADVAFKPKERRAYVDWLYARQSLSGGFVGSPSVSEEVNYASIIQSYTAIVALAILRDDFSRLNRLHLEDYVVGSQSEEGSFYEYGNLKDTPGDARSTYSAVVLATILDITERIQLAPLLDFIQKCEHPSGGFGLRPGTEAHGGATYCLVATLALLNQLHLIKNPSRLIRWLLHLQTPIEDQDGSRSDEGYASKEVTPPLVAGFAGRTNKLPDACYSFWCVSTLVILKGNLDLLDTSLDLRWLLSCQNDRLGGIAKEQDELPDIYHTFLSLSVLSLELEHSERSSPLLTVDPLWNCARHVASHLRTCL